MMVMDLTMLLMCIQRTYPDVVVLIEVDPPQTISDVNDDVLDDFQG